MLSVESVFIPENDRVKKPIYGLDWDGFMVEQEQVVKRHEDAGQVLVAVVPIVGSLLHVYINYESVTMGVILYFRSREIE